MRIAYFTETFLPKVDGVVNTVCRMLEHLGEHSSILFAPQGGPSRFVNTPVIGFRAYPFPLYPELKLAPPFVNVDNALADFKPDVIHLVNPLSLGLVGLRYGRRKNIPVVASYHTDVPGFADRWGLGFLSPVIWAYFRQIHNAADLNLAPSRFTAKQIQARGFHNVKIWGRGVDTNLFSPDKRCEAWRQRLTAGDLDAPLLLSVGRLAIEKRVDWLCEVMKQLPMACLAIVGDGPERAELETGFLV